MAEPVEIYGIKAASEYLNVSRKTVHDWINAKSFPQEKRIIKMGKKKIRVWDRKTLANFKRTLRKREERRSVGRRLDGYYN